MRLDRPIALALLGLCGLCDAAPVRTPHECTQVDLARSNLAPADADAVLRLYRSITDTEGAREA